MSTSSLDLLSHRPAIEPEQIDELRQRLFGDEPTHPIVPGYELEKELGKGAFGRVYRAFDPRFQRTIALKVVTYDSPRALIRIEREAQALARLSHPNVVQVYDKGPTDDGRYFLALEYVDGPSLEHWLLTRPRSRRDILGKFLQIAEGLGAAHQADLVHRDLKPANVIVGHDGRVRVLDFGLARSMETHLDSIEGSRDSRPPMMAANKSGPLWSCAEGSEQTRPDPSALHVVSGIRASTGPMGAQTCGRTGGQLGLRLTADGRFVGTPRYAAPEQFQGRADARSDQFSYCVALYEAFYGRPPFRLRPGAPPHAQLAAQTVSFDARSRRVPRWVVALLRRGLAIEPHRRHRNMAEIADEIRRRLHPRSRVFSGVGLAWVSALTATAAVAGMVALNGTDPIAECRKSRQVAPTGWYEHTEAIRARAPTVGVTDELETWAQGWQAARVQACHQSEPEARAELDACLDDGLAAFDKLTGWLATAERGAWRRLQDHPGPRPLAGLVDTLPQPGQCATEPVASTTIETWEQLLAARVHHAEGDIDQARRRATQAVARARGLGDRSLTAAGEYQLLMLDLVEHRPQTMSSILRLVVEALQAGERGLAADIAAYSLVHSSGGTLPLDPSNPHMVSPTRAEDLIEELEGLRTITASEQASFRSEERGWLRFIEGQARMQLDDYGAARELFRESTELLRQASPPVPAHIVATAEFHEARALAAHAPSATLAATLGARAHAIRRKTLGSHHPLIARETVQLAEIHYRAGEFDTALAHYEDADDQFRTLGAEFDRAVVRGEIAYLHWKVGRMARRDGDEAFRNGQPYERLNAQFQYRRHQALRDAIEMERMMALLRPDRSDEPIVRPLDQARMALVAMRVYGLHKGCWTPALDAGRWLEYVCVPLAGDEIACVKGRADLRNALNIEDARRLDVDCRPEPAPRPEPH